MGSPAESIPRAATARKRGLLRRYLARWPRARRQHPARARLAICAITVDTAAPGAPQRSTPTKSRSVETLMTQAMVMKSRGVLESPSPLRMLLTAL